MIPGFAVWLFSVFIVAVVIWITVWAYATSNYEYIIKGKNTEVHHAWMKNVDLRDQLFKKNSECQILTARLSEYEGARP